MTAAMEKEREAAQLVLMQLDELKYSFSVRGMRSAESTISAAEGLIRQMLAHSLASPQVSVDAIRHGIDELVDEQFKCIAKASNFREDSDSHKKWMATAKIAGQHAYALRKLLPEEKA